MLLSQHSNGSFHLLDAALVGVNLLLHLRLVLFEVSQALLKSHILLSLRDDCRIVGLRGQLKLGQDMRHIVRVNLLQFVPHVFNFSTVGLNLFLILLQLVM